MTTRDDQIRRVLAELDVQIAEVEASVTVLKALLADDEAPETNAPGDLKPPPPRSIQDRAGKD